MLSLLLVLACTGPTEEEVMTPVPNENTAQVNTEGNNGSTEQNGAGQAPGTQQNQGVGLGAPSANGENIGNPNGGQNIGPPIFPEDGENIGDPGPPPEGGGIGGPGPSATGEQIGFKDPNSVGGDNVGDPGPPPEGGGEMDNLGPPPDGDAPLGEQIEPSKTPPTFIFNAQSQDSGPLYKSKDGCFVRKDWDKPPNGKLGPTEERDCPHQMVGEHWEKCLAGRLVKQNVGTEKGTCRCEPIEGEPTDVDCPK